MSLPNHSISLIISFLLITIVSACTVKEDQISFQDVSPENAMDIGKIDKNTNQLTVYRQTDNNPVTIKDCAQQNVCFVIPLNNSMRVLEHVKRTGINQCGNAYEVYIAKVALLDPNTLLDKLDGRVSPELKRAVEAYPKLMDINYENRPLKAIANSEFFLQPEIGLYSDQMEQLDKDFKAFIAAVDDATIEQVIINTLNHKNQGQNLSLMSKVFPAKYTTPIGKLQLFSGSDGAKIKILGKHAQIDELTSIENDAELRSAFSCTTQ